MIDSQTCTLLWAHIQRTAKDLPRSGQSLSIKLPALHQLGNTKIEHLYAPFFAHRASCEHDVAWFNITVHDTFAVGVGKTQTYLSKDETGFAIAHHTANSQAISQWQ